MEPRPDIPRNASSVPRLARLDGLRGIAACVVSLFGTTDTVDANGHVVEELFGR